MKRLFPFGIGIAAICAALISLTGDATARPVAECKDGKCVMSEEDFRRLQEFYKSVRDYAAALEKKAQQDAQGVGSLMQKLNSCMAILEERKT